MSPKTSSSVAGSPVLKPRTIALPMVMAVVAWIASMGTARAQVFGDVTSIGPQTVVGTVGAVSINQVAGVGNQQDNASLITDLPGQLGVSQNSIGNFLNTSDSGKATIGAGSFAGSSGLIQVSQISGAGNLNANAAFVGVSATGDALTAISLSQLRGGFAPPTPSSEFDGSYSIAPTAFAGSSGLVQVEQTAGNNNIAANTMAVHTDAGLAH